MGWEKRRFKRIQVELAVELAHVDIDLNVLQPAIVHKAQIADLSATGMLMYSPKQFRAGSRFQLTMDLQGTTVQFYVIVKHSFNMNSGPSAAYGHGLQIVGGTQASVVTLIGYINTLWRAKVASNGSEGLDCAA